MGCDPVVRRGDSRGVDEWGRRGRWLLTALVVGACAVSLPGAGSTALAADKTSKPATVSEAARVLDLATFPALPDVEKFNQKCLAGVSYEAKSDVKPAFEFYRKKFAERKWQELPGGYVSDQSSSATFAKDGFRVSVSVSAGSQPGMAYVNLLNHGNVDLQKLPLPKDVKPFYSGPVNAAFITAAALEKTKDECLKLILAQGWQPYGQAGDSHFFKQNAVRLHARISTAPAQMGKTVIDYMTELMSADIPAPADFLSAQYSDATTQLTFDTLTDEAAVSDFYRKTLPATGWKVTTEKPFKLDFKQISIFRNPGMDMLTVETLTVEKKTRAFVKFETASEVKEIEKLIAAEAERKKNAKEKPKPRVTIVLSAGAEEVEQTKTKIEFKVGAGKGKGAAEELRKQLVKDKWKAGDAEVTDMFGMMTFTRESQELSVTYVDPGLIPAEITIRASGAELELGNAE